MITNLVILTYRRHEMVRNLVESVLTGRVLPEQIVIIDNTGVAASVSYLKDLLYPVHNIHVIPSLENLGTSGGWNWAMDHFHMDDHVLFANDDVTFHETTFRDLKYSSRYSNAGLIHGSNSSGVPFNLFALSQKAYRQIGKFDQHFRPIYFEDDDYAYRLKLAGYRLEEVETATFGHIGSATLNAGSSQDLEAHHIRFRWNEKYYQMKWGGQPHKEVYRTPFNLGIASEEWHKKQKWLLPMKLTDRAELFVNEFIMKPQE